MHGDRLRGLYLYGSYARGKQDSESDFDVRIILDDVPHYRAEIDRMSHLIVRLSGE
ncbi:MAG: nucleotidyltransferase domain-containing protein [Acidobacteria bacterium]|nr:nucleotidyltransferase domain-containing protein [Acidobacteriota bacterium]